MSCVSSFFLLEIDWSNIILNYLPVIFSAFALAVSFWNLFRNRTVIELRKYPAYELRHRDIEGLGEFFTANKRCIYTTLLVINSSPNNIGYFDLVVKDSETKKKLSLYSSAPQENKKLKININGRTELANFSKYNYGILESKSVKVINFLILLELDNQVDSFEISFKTADKKIKYKKYLMAYDVQKK